MNFRIGNSMVSGNTPRSCNHITYVSIFTLNEFSIIVMCSCHRSRGFVYLVRMLFDVKTAVNYVTINKMANQNSGPLFLTRTLCSVDVSTCVRHSHSYICRNHKINYYKLHISQILIASRNCLNISCHVGPYTGGFSCNCNLARLLVTGGAIGVVASSLLERGEFGVS